MALAAKWAVVAAVAAAAEAAKQLASEKLPEDDYMNESFVAPEPEKKPRRKKNKALPAEAVEARAKAYASLCVVVFVEFPRRVLAMGDEDAFEALRAYSPPDEPEIDESTREDADAEKAGENRRRRGEADADEEDCGDGGVEIERDETEANDAAESQTARSRARETRVVV